MNEPLRPHTPRPVAAAPPDWERGWAEHPPAPPRRSLGVRLLGWTLLTASLGLVSCQSLFFP